MTATLALPALEAVAGLLLIPRRTRQIGLIGAVVLHVGLVAIVGPFGLGHSATVVGWNLALLLQVLLLFGPRPEVAWRDVASAAVRSRLAWIVIAACLLPLAERSGWWDTWPSFALYASHNERVEVRTDAADTQFWPAALRRHLVEQRGAPMAILDMSGWSRERRGVVPYPQARVQVGWARWLGERVRPAHGLRVTVLGRAGRFDGRRAILYDGDSRGLDRLGEAFWLNWRPAGRRSRW
jgi:hypothetical protein